MYPYSSEHIVARATPPGASALALIRISGDNLIEPYNKMFRKELKDRLSMYLNIYDPATGKLLDQSIVTYFKGPRSFTGEDVLEISCHGGQFVCENILSAIVGMGARIANPGEFSLRAFLNGKIDLIQAEAICELINSKSQFSTNIHLQHAGGLASKKINSIRNNALNILSLIENELNFSENEITLSTQDDIKNTLEEVANELSKIVDSSIYGKDIMHGYRIIIIGKPNVGKSSLFNAIIAKDRAIVSSQAGTTRDTVESYFEINGIPICLIDTAGLWESSSVLDNLGMKKTITELTNANLCLIVDNQNPKELLTADYMKQYDGHYLLIKSKCDETNNKINHEPDIINISAINSNGIDKLLTLISTKLISNNININEADSFFLARRQRKLLSQAHKCVINILQQCALGVQTDILASSLRMFIDIIKEVVGEISDEEIIKNIFSKFCIGK